MLALMLLACAPDPIVLSDVSVELDEAVATMPVVRWTQDTDADATWLIFSTADGGERTSPRTARAAGEGREVVLGVPQLTEVTVQVVAERDGVQATSDALTVTTGALPEEATLPTQLVWEPALASEAEYVLASIDINGGGTVWGPFWLVILDRQGNIVWYHDLNPFQSMFPRVSRDGTHIVFDHRVLLDELGTEASIRRMTLDGRYLEEIAVPGYGWSWDELPDGTILYDQLTDTDSINLQEVSPDGSRRMVWDCGVWLSALGEEARDCNTNTVNWTEASDSVLWSTYWGDFVVEVSREDGEVLWYAGDIDGGWDFDPPEAAFEMQHYPNYTPDGTLLVSTHVPGLEGEQRAREYTVDHDTQTLTEVWSYGEGVDRYAEYSGEAVRLSGGNTLINYGTGGEIREVTADGQPAWVLRWGEGWTLGHTELIDDIYALNVGP